MSVRIPRSSLSQEQIDTVVNLLMIQPKEKFIPNKNKKFYSYSNTTTKTPIQLFKLDEETNELIIPYTFYKQLTGNLSNINKNFPIIPYNFIGTLREDQIPIVEEALNHLNQYGTTTLNVYTAFGKTVTATYLACQYGMLTLVLYTSTTLEPQWKKTFSQFTNAKIWIVGENPPVGGAHIILCMDTRFEKLPKDYLAMVGTVLIDEAHEFCTLSRIKCLLGVQPLKIISMTATLERSDQTHTIIQSVCGMHNIFKKSTKPFNVYRFVTGVTIPIVLNTQGNPDWSKYCNFQSLDDSRNIMILNMIKENSNFKILILTWLKDHVNLLYNSCQQMGISVDFMAGNKKKYSDSQVLIGTISKLGTGFDEKTACDNFNGTSINLLLMVATMDSVQLLEQVAGRAFRSEFPHIIYFVDNNKIAENHWKKAKKWFESRNGTIYEHLSPQALLLKEKEKLNKSKLSLAETQLNNLSLLRDKKDGNQSSVIFNNNQIKTNMNLGGNQMKVIPDTNDQINTKTKTLIQSQLNFLIKK